MHADDIVLGPVLVRQAADVPRPRSGDLAGGDGARPAAAAARAARRRLPRRCPSAAPDDPPLDDALPPPRAASTCSTPTPRRRVAIAAARAGHNLLIQGPPGTGKSQTIANLIAAAVHDGRTVLFVAEKMAALEVVKRRLDQIGLGEALPGAAQPAQQQARPARGARADAAARRARGQDDPGDRFEELAAARSRPQPPRCRACIGRSAAPASAPSRRSAGWPRCTAAASCRRRSSCPAPTHWQRAELRERRDQVAGAGPARRPSSACPPSTPGAASAWRRCCRASIRRSAGAIEALARADGAAVQGGDQAAGVARHRARSRRRSSGSSALSEACASLAELPADDADASRSRPVWQPRAAALEELVAAGEALRRGARASCARWSPRRPGRRSLPRRAATSRRIGAFWWRWFKALLPARPRDLARPSRPSARRPICTAQLALLDRLIAAQADARSDRRRTTPSAGPRSAGCGPGERSDWSKLGAVLAWRRDLAGPGAAAPPAAPARRGRRPRAADPAGRAAAPGLLAGGRRRLGATGRASAARPGRGLRRAAGSRRCTLDRIARAPGRAGPSSRRRSQLWIGYWRPEAADGRRSACRGLPISYTTAACPPSARLDAFDQAYYEAQLRQAFEADASARRLRRAASRSG